ncbi:hypothetical protein CHS0354_016393 [Potamilus streckersoni]|uniref:Uncharacterized protein n=1 Tax=Potamilus streckersoni TaxID=2493646 RepID=A0AAE0W3Q1_9BIVA|nr:hypothetical protein CHS0354_016393 [Potamilus streckersoni]
MEEGQEQPYNANPLKLTEYIGVLYPYYFGREPRVRLENIKNFQSKTGDIFVCSYPKSADRINGDLIHPYW